MNVTRTCAYQGFRNVIFFENLAYMLSGCPLLNPRVHTHQISIRIFIQTDQLVSYDFCRLFIRCVKWVKKCKDLDQIRIFFSVSNIYMISVENCSRTSVICERKFFQNFQNSSIQKELQLSIIPFKFQSEVFSDN